MKTTHGQKLMQKKMVEMFIDMILEKIDQLLKEVSNLQASNAEEIEQLRLKYLSKKGEITALMADFRNVAADQKKAVGIKINELKQLKYTIVGADANGYDVRTLERTKGQKIALFLGSEGEGLSKKVINKLDISVSISMAHDFDSLNVSVAAGILIHSFVE